jgi:hypothetical protein
MPYASVFGFTTIEVSLNSLISLNLGESIVDQNTESSHYDAVIADLEARRNHLNVTIETLRQIRAQADSNALPPLPPLGALVAGGVAEIAHDAFFEMTIADAAIKYLKIVKQTRSTAEIAKALEAGGLKHSSKNFVTTIRSTLGQREEFRRVNGEWGLSEWYRKEREPIKRKGTDKPRKRRRTTKGPENA